MRIFNFRVILFFSLFLLTATLLFSYMFHQTNQNLNKDFILKLQMLDLKMVKERILNYHFLADNFINQLNLIDSKDEMLYLLLTNQNLKIIFLSDSVKIYKNMIKIDDSEFIFNNTILPKEKPFPEIELPKQFNKILRLENRYYLAIRKSFRTKEALILISLDNIFENLKSNYASISDSIIKMSSKEQKPTEIISLNDKIFGLDITILSSKTDTDDLRTMLFIFILLIICIFFVFLKLYELDRDRKNLNFKLLKESEELDRIKRKFQILLDRLNDITICEKIINIDFKVVYVGKNFKNLTGYSDFLKQSYIGLIYHEDRANFISKVKKCIKNSKDFELTYRITTKDNKIKWIYERGTFTKVEYNTILNSFLFENTKQMRILEELKRAKIDAIRANVAKSQFLANMSHEIRTPLNAIIGMTYLISKTTLSQKQREFISAIDISSKNLLALINDILDFSKIEANKLTLEHICFDLDSIIMNIDSTFQLLAQQKKVAFIIDVDKSIPTNLVGDPVRIAQILINLVGNAIKFTDKGYVKLSIKPIAYISEHRIKLLFNVEDTGAGIEKDVIAILFKDFIQADSSTTRKHGGTGLGLSITKKLVELMGGKIMVDSKIRVGSQFLVELELDISKKGCCEIHFKDKNSDKLNFLLFGASLKDSIKPLIDGIAKNIVSVNTSSDAIQSLRDNRFDIIIISYLAIQVDDFKFLKLLDEVQKEKIILILNSFKEDSIDSIRIFNIKNSLTKPIKQEFLFDLISKIAKSKALEPLSGANILVVEDNELNQRVIKGVLEGNKIDIASNGKEAIDKIESNFYDVVFMDIAMPILDGYEATKLIRKKYKDLPIIGLSANTTKENRDKALKYGMNDYILKPINPTILFDILAKYVKIDGRPKPQENLNSVKILKLSNIDIEDVLHRLKYEELFLDLCNMFLKNHSDSYDKIKQAIALKEMDKAILIAHSIKGVSANLSGKALYQSSLELEKALKSGENFEKELNNFRDKLQLFIDDINEILKRQNGKNY